MRVIVGSIALLLGAIGVLIPVWPTTPFVLLSIGCFSATPAIQKRILKIDFFREYYESYQQGKGLKKSTVIFSLIFLWGMLAISAFYIKKWTVSLILLLVGIGVTIHILHIAKPKHQLQNPESLSNKIQEQQ